METFPLAHAALGEQLVLMRSEGSPEQCRRLAALGLRRGAQVRLVHRTAGGGRVVNVAGARIALDREMLSRLHVERATAAEAVVEADSRVLGGATASTGRSDLVEAGR